MQTKANSDDFIGRFREIISDPLNLLIQRKPNAGCVDGDLVYLHNGLQVPISGPNAYYGNFSLILVANRGVHEPLEEFVFQELIKKLPVAPQMLELGAYWGHYSMWLKMERPEAVVRLVEPELQNLQAGIQNFARNGLTGEFIHAFVGKGHFEIDCYLEKQGISKIDILHADIQGYEVEMLESCFDSLASKKIDYLFISTHSQELHCNTVGLLEKFGYRIEVSSDYDYGTTSFDGLIFASSPSVNSIFKEFSPLKRVQITEARPAVLIDYLSKVISKTTSNDENGNGEVGTLNNNLETCMEADEIKERIGRFPFWYHKIELPHGIVTPGWAPLVKEYYRVPERLDNKRVLDVGAWDGYWTFEAIKRGASQAVAIDDFSDFLGSLPQEDRKAWQTFDTCREIIGLNEQQCPRFDMSVYDIRKDTFGMFDVVFFFGTLYHLRHPLLALDRLFDVCREEIYIESAILDDFSPYRGGLGQGYPNGQMVMEFYPEDQYGNNVTNWWVPTLACMMQMVKAAGFEYVEGWKLMDNPENLPLCRGFVKGVKRAG